MSKYYCILCDIKIKVECEHNTELGIFRCKECDALLNLKSSIIIKECCEVAYSQLIQEQPEFMKND